MDNPYLIIGPAVISFSGGRTSAYMLRKILDAYGGVLPPDVVVCFANTGKERNETLDFVQECGARWNVLIVWLERQPGEHGSRFLTVSHNSASRNGEPFKQLMHEKNFLPNPVTRFCTIELKIRVMRDYARSIGFDHWTNIVGLRADEPGRVAKATDPERARERWVNLCPLSTAGATEEDVLKFWAEQPFDLKLKSYEGNCDLCFLKGAGKITRIMLERPDLVGWWIEAEAEAEAEARNSRPEGAFFRNDRPSYAALFETTRRQGILPFVFFDDLASCDEGCTDQEPASDLRELKIGP